MAARATLVRFGDGRPKHSVRLARNFWERRPSYALVMIEPLGELIPRVSRSVWVHPSAVVIGDVEIGEDSSVWPGAVLRGDFGPITVGARTCIQDNAVIHSDGAGTRIGSNCIVGHLAFIEEADVDDECLIGVGARVLNGVRLRRGAVVAAGAVVLRGVEVPGGHRAQGVPAQIVQSSFPDRDYILRGAGRYHEMALRFLRQESERDPPA